MELWLDDEEVELIKEYLAGEGDLSITDLFIWEASPEGHKYWSAEYELEIAGSTISHQAKSNLKQYVEQHEK